MPVPQDIATYLAGIGDLVDSNSREFRLHVQGVLDEILQVAGAQGSYGIVGDDTHIVYESLPSPLVSLLKIRADLEYTTRLRDDQQPDAWLNPLWDLPANADFLLPTSNLLGWSRRERLPADVEDALAGANFTIFTN